MNSLVSNIVSNPRTLNILSSYGLNANRVTWEDTGRNKDSCWGPNISDMTLCIKDGNQLMPIIRVPNFGDVTQDVPMDAFRILVGNETNNHELKLLTIKEYLQNLDQYVDTTHKINLYNERDTHILTSSQCCLLPCQDNGNVEFNVQLFNYQSYDENPAVLVILATKDGSSAQVVERCNQKLFFNDHERAKNFVAERLKDIREKRTGKKQEKVKSFKEMTNDEKLENSILVFQIPLKIKEKSRHFLTESCLEKCVNNDEDDDEYEDEYEDGCCDLFGDTCTIGSTLKNNNLQLRGEAPVPGVSISPWLQQKSGMDMGVISLGKDEGHFVGTKNLELVRDDRLPIRCTFQYYRVTDKGDIDGNDVQDISEQLKQAERIAEGHGSLVWSTTHRVTEPVLNQLQFSDNPLQKMKVSFDWCDAKMAAFY